MGRDTWREIWAEFWGFFWQKCCQGCSDPAPRSRRQTAGGGSCFLDLGLRSITQRLLEANCSCSGKHFWMLTLGMGTFLLSGDKAVAVTIKGKLVTDSGIFDAASFALLMVSSISHISSTHSAPHPGNSWEILLEFHVFPFQESQL